jgi:hypothetical protein
LFLQDSTLAIDPILSLQEKERAAGNIWMGEGRLRELRMEAGKAVLSRRRLIRNGLLLATNCVWMPWAFGRKPVDGESLNPDGSGSSWVPLGSFIQTTPAAWDGFARLATSGNGVIAVFRNKSQEAAAKVCLPLMPAGKYKLRSVISGRVLGVFDRSNWAGGVSIAFPDASPVDILEVTSI